MDLTLDRFGRVVIPKRVRDRLGLHPGSRLRLDVDDRAGHRRVQLEVVGSADDLAPSADQIPLERIGSVLVFTGRWHPDAPTDTLDRNPLLLALDDDRLRHLIGGSLYD